MARMAWRSMVANLPRLVLTLLGVALAAALLGATLVLSTTLGGDAAGAATRAMDGRDVVVRGRAGAGGTIAEAFGADRALVDAGVLSRIRSVDGVAAAEGEVRAPTTITDGSGTPLRGRSPVPTLGQGWLGGSPLDQWTLVEGQGPRTADEAVVDRATFRSADLHLGDRIGVTGADGEVHLLRLVGVARGRDGDTVGPAGAVLVDPATASNLFAEHGRFSWIAIQATPGIPAAVLRDRVAAVLPPDARATTAAQQAAMSTRSLMTVLAVAQRFLLGFAALAILLAAHAVANSFSILLTQRRHELAMLRVIGVPRRRLVTSVGIEAAILGALAGAAGLLAGVLLGALITTGLRASGLVMAGGTVRVPTLSLLGAAGLVSLVTTLAATLPALREARLPAVEALRHAEVEPVRRPRGVWAATLVAAVAVGVGLASTVGAPADRLDARWAAAIAATLLIALLLAAPAVWSRAAAVIDRATRRRWASSLRMAARNLARLPQRAGRLVTALLAAITVLVGLSVASASMTAARTDQVRQAVRADLVLRPVNGAAVVPPTAEAAVAATPAVASTSGVGLGAAEADDHPAAAVGVDPDAIGDDLDLRVVAGRLDDLAPDAVVTTTASARDHGWHVGSTITGEFVATGYERLRIVGLVDGELPSATGIPLLMRKADLDRRVPPARRGDALVFVRLQPGADVAAARRSIDAALVGHPTVRSATIADVSDTGALPVAPVVDALSALVLIATAIALLGVANTMLLTTIGRVREVGLLRAIGMGRRQVTAMIRWEAVLSAGTTAIAGTLAGALVGALLARSLTTGTTVSLPWLRIAAIVGGALLATLLATHASSRHVARVPVLDAITSR